MKKCLGTLSIFSLALNVLLICVGLFFILKRWHFQYKMDHPASFPSYSSNPIYIEQVGLQAVYDRHVKVIMLGNSFIQRSFWDELLNRGDIGNRGIGSDITDGYLHRLEYVIDEHPAICFIEGGVNDLADHFPENKIVSNLSGLVDTLKRSDIIPVIHTVFYVASNYPDADRFNAKISSLNKKIILLCSQKGIDCIDLNPQISKDETRIPEYSQPDGIHFTGKAYAIWKSAIEKILLKYNI